MSEVVDNRVVEMQFDNADFERNIKESLQSLQRIEKAINNLPKSANGFEKLSKSANNLDFSKLADNVEQIANRMTVTGIAAMKIITDVTGFIEKKVVGLGKKISSMITEGGKKRAANIQKAKFQLEGLGIAWNDISEDIDHGVKDTAYGLDAAANAASQLSASGVEFGKTFGATGSSPMAKALRGISGVAAMTQSSYEEIANIFTTVAGQGRMMTMQLNQVAGRGLNVASTITEFMNKISEGTDESLEHISDNVKKTVKDITKGAQITEEQLRELVTKGKINFAIFSEAMDDAFGEHAKDANKTFEGVISNIRSAFSRIGQNFFEPLKENGGPVVRVLNEIRELINKINKATKDYIRATARSIASVLNKIAMISQYLTDNGGWTNVIEGLGNAFKALVDVISPVIVAFKKFFPNTTAQSVLDLTKRFKEFTEELRLSDDAMWNIYTVAKAVADLFETLKNIFVTFVSSLTPGTKSVLSLLDSFMHGTAYTIAFTSALLKYIFTAERVEGIATGIRNGIFKAFDGIKNLIIDIKNFGSTLVDTLGEFEVFREIGQFISDLAVIVVYALVNAVQKATQAFRYFRDALHDVNKEDIRPYIQSLNKILTVFWNLLKTIGGAVFNAFGFIYDAVSSLKIFNKEVEKTEKPLKTVNEGLKIFNDTTKVLSNTFSSTASNASKVGKELKGVSTQSSKYLKTVENGVTSVNNKLVKSINNWNNLKTAQIATNKAAPKESTFVNKKDINDLASTLASNTLDQLDSLRTVSTGLKDLKPNLKIGKELANTVKTVTKSTKELQETLSKLPAAKIVSTGKETTKVLGKVTLGINSVSKSSVGLYETVSKLSIGKALTAGLADSKFSIKDIFTGILKGIREALGRISPTLLAFGDAIIGGIKIVFDRVKTFVGGIIDYLKKLDWGRGVVLAFVGVVIYAVFKIANTIGSIPYLIFNVTKSMANMTAAFKGLVGGKADSLYTGVVKIAAAIGIFAASLKLMSTIDVDQLKRCVAIVAGFVATLLGFTFLFANFTSLPFISEIFGSTGFNMMARGVMAFGSAFASLAISLKILEELDINKVTSSLATFFTVLISFSSASILVMPALKDLTIGSFAILAFAIAITAIIKSLVKLQELSPEQINSSLVGISVTIMALTALTETAKKFPFKSGLGIIALVAAIMLLPKAFDAIVNSGFSFEYLAKNIQQLSVGFILLAALAGIIRIAGQGSIGVAASLLAITVTLRMLPTVLSLLIETIKKNKPENISRANGVIVTFLVGIGAAFALIAACSGLSLKAVPILLSISMAILTLSMCMKLLGTLSLGDAIIGLAALGGMFAVLVVLTAISAASERANLKPILGLTFLLVALAASIAVLSFVPWPLLLSTVGALSLVLGMLYLCFQELSKMDDLSNKSFKVALSMGAVILAIGGSLYLLKDMKVESIVIGALALGILVAVVGEVIHKISTMKTKDALPGILSLSVLIATLGGVLFLLGKFCEPTTVLASAGALMIVSIALGIFLAIADQMKNTREAALSLVILSVGLIAIAGAFMLLGQLSLPQIGTGLIAIAGALGILLLAAFVAQLKPVAAGLVALCAAFTSLGIAAIEFGIGAALIGAGVFLIANAFKILLEVFAKMSEIDLANVAIGLVAIAGSIVTFSLAMGVFALAAMPFTGALMLISTGVGALSLALIAFGIAAISIGAGILLLSNGFTTLAAAFTSISNLDLGSIEIGLVGVAAAIVVLTLASVPFMVVAVPLSLALIALSVAIGILSAALMAFGTALGMIAASLSVMAAFGGIVGEIGTAIQGAVAAIKSKVGEFVDAGKTLIGGIVTGAKSVVGKVKEIGGTIAGAMKEGYEKDGVTGMIAAGADAVKGLVLGVHNNMHEAIAAFSGLAESSLYDGFAPTAEWQSPWGTLIRAGADAVEGLAEGVGDNLSKVSKPGKELGIKFLDGFRDAVGWHSAWESMVNAMKDWLAGLTQGASENSGAAFDLFHWLGDMLGFNMEDGVAPHLENIQAMINETMGMVGDRQKIMAAIRGYNRHPELDNSGEWYGGANDKYRDPYFTNLEKKKEKEEVPTPPGGGAGGGKGGGGGGSSAETKKSTEIMDYARKVVEKYNEAFGNLYKTAGDTSSLEASKAAVTDLAKAMYEAQGNVLDGTDEKLAEALEAFKTFSDNMKKTMKETLMSTEEFKESFDFKPKDLMKNMDSNKKALNKWFNYLELAYNKGIDKGYLHNIASAGFSAESLNKLRYLGGLHGDEIDKFNARIAEAGNVEEMYSNRMSRILAILEGSANKLSADNSFTLALKEKFNEWRTIATGYMLNFDEVVQRAEEGYKSSLQHFKKFTVSQEDREITIDSLIENEKSQKKAQEMFTQHLKGIIDKGGSQELIDHIMSMGYEQGYAYAKAIDDGTEEQIKELGGLFHATEYESPKENAEDLGYSYATAFTEGMDKMTSEMATYLQEMANGEHYGFIPEDLSNVMLEIAKAMFGSEEAARSALGYFNTNLDTMFNTIATDEQAAGMISNYAGTLASNFANGFKSTEATEALTVATSGVTDTITDAFLASLESNEGSLEKIEEIGSIVPFSFENGIVKNIKLPEDAAKTLSEGIVDTSEGIITLEKFRDISNNIIEGLKQGLYDGKDDVLSAIRDLCSDMAGTMEEETEIASPSKLFARFGRFIDLGLAQGISQNADIAIDETVSLAQRTVDSFNSVVGMINDILADNMDYNPSIVPVLDTTMLQNGMGYMNGLFDTGYGIGIGGQYADAVSASFANKEASEDSQQNPGNTYNFTQNNYSPKALSRLDIYRQTKNQFTRMKGVVEAR